MVLLIVDTQKLITNNSLYCFDLFVSNVKALIQKAREKDIEIIYIRHDDGAGNELTKGTEGFEIYDDFKPINGEKIFDKKFNSAFKETGLLEYLISKKETQLIITGLQTDYCIDATVKCGFEHGFQIIVPEHGNTTVNNNFLSGENSYKYYNEFIWNGRYAKCIPMNEMIDMMNL
jgi:nicotinamidase-related amidase